MTNQEAIKELKGLINSIVGREEIDRVCREVIEYLQKQEPRVMTLEEIQSIETWNQNTPPYLWVEGITERDSRWNYWRAIRTALRLPGTMGVQNYGSKWRVWNLQPSPEQMRDTPWDVSPEVRKKWELDDEIASGIGQTFSPD